ILIALEFFIGITLILQLKLRKITYKVSIATLLVFCLYLITQIFFSGNKGNCGCFGTAIYMTPLQALIKNFILIIVLILLHKFHNGWGSGKFSNWLYTLLFITAGALPFILNPV